jgi:hypothetical protein
MHVVSIRCHSSNDSSDINGSLLLPPTVATGYMTSYDHCCCWSRGTHAVATSSHSSDEHSNISSPSLLPPSSDGLSNISGPLLLYCQ